MRWPWTAATPRPVDVPRSLTSAATVMQQSRRMIGMQSDTWQNEVWAYYDSLDEFRFGVEWHSNALSRVRLRAGQLNPDQDEPEIADSGPAADLVAQLCGDVAGRASLMKSLTQLLDVPGECYLVGETLDGTNVWTARSTEELRTYGHSSASVEIIDDERSLQGQVVWREMSAESLWGRVWRPHARFKHLADSPARAARNTMRELELINRKMQATYLSRLASAGIIVFPEEVTFPVRDEFNDAPDPFVAEWMETAATAIREPGTASSIVPIPMRVPGEYVDKVRFIDFTQASDERIVEKRDSAIRRLATALDLPAEVLLGIGQMNHWSAWQLDEAAIKIHIVPSVELICAALTRIYLHPMLKAMGQDVTNFVVWYDCSELTLRPDRTNPARDAYDRFEISGRAFRRETGFDEDDAPTDDEVRDAALKAMVKIPQYSATALNALVPNSIEEVTVPTSSTPVSGDAGPPTDQPPPSQSPRAAPNAGDGPPSPPPDARGPQASALDVVTRALTDVDVLEHDVSLDLLSGHMTVEHPADVCRPADCPVTWAAYRYRGPTPGTSGRYRLGATADGELAIGVRIHDRPEFSSTSRVR